MKKIMISSIIAGIILVGGVIGIKSAHMVKPGYVGVVYSLNGGIQDDQVLSQGLKFVNPFSKVNQYSVATEQAYLSRDTKEGSKLLKKSYKKL